MDILGIDIGGSGIKGAPVTLQTGELASERLYLPTPQPATPAGIAGTVGEIVRHFRWTGPIGCGLPAAVRNGIACTAANIDRSWIGVDTVTLFGEAAGCPTTVLNDADAAGLAEMAYGAGKGRPGTVLLITVGTGLGSALFRDGVLVPNTELGHLVLDGEVAEKFASAATRKRLELSYRQWARRFDRYLQHLEQLFWPDLFIIGGGISKEHEKFLPHLSIATPTVPADLRNEAGIVGAALAAAQS